MRIPVDEVIGLLVPVMPVTKVPPTGLTIMLYWLDVLHKAGMREIVGVGGLTAVTEMVLAIGQLIKLGVTTTVYTMVVCVPIGVLGDIMVDCALLPAKKVDGDHEYEYCAKEGGLVKVSAEATLLPGHKVGLFGLTV